jgi:FMN phosphatase YigB (HAD superfamily)
MKYAAFDVGNVLVRVDFDPFEKAFESYSIDDNYMDFLLDLHGAQDIGLTTIARHAKLAFGASQECCEHLMEAWDHIIVPNPKMCTLLQELKDDGVNIAILSNMGIEHAKLMRKKYPEIFEGCTLHLSCEVGARKPAKLYYQSFLQDHPEFKGCVYVDDRDDNLATGLKYGFTSYKFDLDKFELLSDENKASATEWMKAAIMR